MVKYVNIQGLTNIKMCEIEKLIDNNTIMCLTETQLKINKIKVSESLRQAASMRDLKDKKGGGIVVFWRKDSEIEIEEIQTKIKDMLYVKCKIRNKHFYMVIV